MIIEMSQNSNIQCTIFLSMMNDAFLVGVKKEQCIDKNGFDFPMICCAVSHELPWTMGTRSWMKQSFTSYVGDDPAGRCWWGCNSDSISQPYRIMLKLVGKDFVLVLAVIFSNKCKIIVINNSQQYLIFLLPCSNGVLNQEARRVKNDKTRK